MNHVWLGFNTLPFLFCCNNIFKPLSRLLRVVKENETNLSLIISVALLISVFFYEHRYLRRLRGEEGTSASTAGLGFYRVLQPLLSLPLSPPSPEAKSLPCLFAVVFLFWDSCFSFVIVNIVSGCDCLW